MLNSHGEILHLAFYMGDLVATGTLPMTDHLDPEEFAIARIMQQYQRAQELKGRLNG